MSKIGDKYVLDSYALIAYFLGEAKSVLVKDLIKDALEDQTNLYMSIINVGEIYYVVYKSLSKTKACDILQDIHRLPIKLYEANEKLVMKSAEIKAIYPISYADSFVASLAREINASIVTGDPEFRSLEKEINIVWL
jgi:uncharacterized protein